MLAACSPRQLAGVERMPLVNWPPIHTDPVAVALGLFPLQRVVVVALAYCLKAVVVAPEQFCIAVVRYQVVDYRGPWVCPAASETASALLAGVVVPEQDALPCRLPPGGLEQRAGHRRYFFPQALDCNARRYYMLGVDRGE